MQQNIFPYLPYGTPYLMGRPYMPSYEVDIINYYPSSANQPTAKPSCPPSPPSTCSISTKLVSESYQMILDDCYVGVQSTGPTTITLPLNPDDGQIAIVKVEMQAPIGNKKVTINTGDSSLIDGKSSIVLQNQWESRTFIFRGDDWYTIS
jgi:hypothetical protein